MKVSFLTKMVVKIRKKTAARGKMAWCVCKMAVWGVRWPCRLNESLFISEITSKYYLGYMIRLESIGVRPMGAFGYGSIGHRKMATLSPILSS